MGFFLSFRIFRNFTSLGIVNVRQSNHMLVWAVEFCSRGMEFQCHKIAVGGARSIPSTAILRSLLWQHSPPSLLEQWWNWGTDEMGWGGKRNGGKRLWDEVMMCTIPYTFILKPPYSFTELTCTLIYLLSLFGILFNPIFQFFFLHFYCSQLQESG